MFSKPTATESHPCINYFLKYFVGCVIQLKYVFTLYHGLNTVIKMTQIHDGANRKPDRSLRVCSSRVTTNHP